MTAIQETSQHIIALCQEPNTALQAIHLIISVQGASVGAWQAVYQRVITDNDAQAAYYLVNFAQKIDDLPFDARPLIELILNHGDDTLKDNMLAKLPPEAKATLKELRLI